MDTFDDICIWKEATQVEPRHDEFKISGTLAHIQRLGL